MPLKTPSFWYQDKATLKASMLRPLSWLYQFGARKHLAKSKPQAIDLPVICVGNLTAGGSGKTPTAIAIMDLIKKHGLTETPFFLSRGYGQDEEFLLRDHAAVVTEKNRFKGAKKAQANHADFLIMDDGLQNYDLQKDISFLVIDGSMGFGNRLSLPAGPLREPVKSGLKKADAVIFIGEDRHNILTTLPEGLPVFKAVFKAEDIPPKDKSYLAFAGLGYPQKFFDFLRNDCDLSVTEEMPFPDHHKYTKQDIKRIHERAVEIKAEPITTEKDFVKIVCEAAIPIHVLKIKLAWAHEDQVAHFIKEKLSSKRS